MLDAGYNPMRFFASDYKKYFYLAELYSLIDLSSVGPACRISSCSLSERKSCNHILWSVRNITGIA